MNDEVRPHERLAEIQKQFEGISVDIPYLANIIGYMVANDECRCFKCDKEYRLDDNKYKCSEDFDKVKYDCCTEWRRAYWAARKAVLYLLNKQG